MRSKCCPASRGELGLARSLSEARLETYDRHETVYISYLCSSFILLDADDSDTRFGDVSGVSDRYVEAGEAGMG